MNHVCIIGGGFMGTALARYFLNAAVQVTIIEPFQMTREKLLLEEALKDARILTNIEECGEVDFIIEAIPENLNAKQELFEKIDELFPVSVIFCTNTSSFLISSVAERMKNKERLIGTHFFSPAHITPLVEVVPSEYTATHHIQKTMDFLQAIHKKPVLLKKEIRGFVANRLQSALSREAMSLVQKGIVTPDELDFIAKWSLGIRLANTGPLEQRDINGLDTHMAIAEYVYPTLENSTEPLSIHKEKMESGAVGMKSNKGFYDWSSIDQKTYSQQKEEVLVKVIEAVSGKGEKDEL